MLAYRIISLDAPSVPATENCAEKQERETSYSLAMWQHVYFLAQVHILQKAYLGKMLLEQCKGCGK